MGYFYFDESMHQQEDFIIGAYIYSEIDLTDKIYDEIKKVGLIPRKDEYKSSDIKINNKPSHIIRYNLWELIFSESIKSGLLVLPYNKRNFLGEEALTLLMKICKNNNLMQNSHNVYYDQEITFSTLHNNSSAFGFPNNFKFFKDQDSKIIAGIQIADLMAHTFSGMLRPKITGKRKIVDDGFMGIDLDFELWARIRHSLFYKTSTGLFSTAENDPEYMTVNTADYALHISDYCSITLKKRANDVFGKTYIGCIH